MMISEEALYAAAPEAAEKFLSALPDREDCVHDFSPDFEARMATLLRRQRRRRHWRALLAAAAVLGALLVLKVRTCLPFLLAFAAGAMIYVVVEELIPESQTNENKDWMALFTLVGFSVMMVMDVALG